MRRHHMVIRETNGLVHCSLVSLVPRSVGSCMVLERHELSLTKFSGRRYALYEFRNGPRAIEPCVYVSCLHTYP